jgi:hypothetical protein
MSFNFYQKLWKTSTKSYLYSNAPRENTTKAAMLYIGQCMGKRISELLKKQQLINKKHGS